MPKPASEAPQIEQVVADLENQLQVVQRFFQKEDAVKTEFQQFFLRVLTAINRIYEQSHNTIEHYKLFDLYTNLIWTASDNIYRLNAGRAKELTDELQSNHFQSRNELYPSIYISKLFYEKRARIAEITPITIKAQASSFYFCTAFFKIYPKKTDYEEKTIRFYFDWSTPKSRNNISREFAYTVVNYQVRAKLTFFFEVMPGLNTLDVLVQLDQGSVYLKRNRLNCVNIRDYPKLAEYKVSKIE